MDPWSSGLHHFATATRPLDILVVSPSGTLVLHEGRHPVLRVLCPAAHAAGRSMSGPRASESDVDLGGHIANLHVQSSAPNR